MQRKPLVVLLSASFIVSSAAVTQRALAAQVPATGTTFINGAHGLCLDAAAEGAGANGGKVQSWHCLDDANQRWAWRGNQLVNGQAGLCLDAPPASNGANGAKVQVWKCLSDAPRQQW